jgi:hypothetical protein
MLRRR